MSGTTAPPRSSLSARSAQAASVLRDLRTRLRDVGAGLRRLESPTTTYYLLIVATAVLV